MFIRGLYFILLFIFLSKFVEAQTSLKGNIKDKNTNETIPGVTILLKEPGKLDIKSFAITDKEGNYSLTYQIQHDSVLLEVSSMGYEKISLLLPNGISTYNFSLESKEFVLQEVRVKGDRIWQKGDTIVYSAAAFTSVRDRYLEDILKKMPGISVNSNGIIEYGGKPINRFTIEGMNLLEGKYTLASRNLQVDRVASIEVLENHQPVKVLEEVEPSDRAAINVKLKKDRKNTWILNGNAGIGGFPLLWRANVFSMQVAPKKQGLYSYKGNNTGEDLMLEIEGVSLDEYISGLYVPSTSSLLGSLFLSPPDLNTQRSFFNQSHIFTLNQLWKPKEDTDLRLNIDFMYEQQEQENFISTEYFQVDTSNIVFSENSNVNSKMKGVKGLLTYEKNNSSAYIQNKTTFSGKWKDVESDVKNENLLFQKQEIPEYAITNRFQLIKTVNKNRFHLSSINHFTSLPQNLKGIIEKMNMGYTFSQEAEQKVFLSRTSLQYGRSFQKWNGDFRMAYEAKMSDINTVLDSGRELSFDTINKNIQWEHTVSFSPELKRVEKKWNLTLRLPISLNFLNNDRDNINRFFFTPSASFKYDLSKNIEWNINGSYNQSLGNYSETFSGRLINYRTVYYFAGVYPENKTVSIVNYVRYKNVISALFGNVSFIYRNSRRNNINEREIRGDYIITNLIKHHYNTETYQLSADISKSFEWKNFTSKIKWTGSKDNLSMVQTGQVLPYSIFYNSLKPEINLELFKDNLFSYALEYRKSKQKIHNNESKTDLIKQDFNLFFTIISGLNLSFTGEHLYNRLSSQNKINVFLADIEARYNINKKLEFNIKWSNIFDKKNYSYISYSDLSETYYSYKIRPSEILFSLYYKF